MLEQGAPLAGYEVVRRLAVGGMGEVYLCRHLLLDRIDAVKVLLPHLATDPVFRKRFLHEALSAARLRHPHIVTVYTAGEVNGQLYLAMEYIEGDDLAAIIARERRLSLPRTIHVLAQIASALDAAHGRGLTHRDVKPTNVLVEPAGQAYLVDFGIAKAMSDQHSDLTMAGQVVGTASYISPEQLEAKPLDGRCDQYALACVAYECLTGGIPYPRESQIAALTAHLTATPPRVTDARPDVPVAVDAVIARGMAKAPADRYPTCAAFVEALRAAAVPPRPAAPPVSAPPVSPAPAAQVSPAPPVSAPAPPRSPAPVAAAPVSAQPVSAQPVSAQPVSAQPAAPPPVRKSGPMPLWPSRDSIATPARPDVAAPVAEPVRVTAPAAPGVCLATIGGPDSGRVVEMLDGANRISLLGGATLAVQSSGGQLWPDGTGSMRVNGQTPGRGQPLATGDLVDVGCHLFQVRPAKALVVQSNLPDAVTIARRGGERPAGDADPRLLARIGWLTGKPPATVATPLAGDAPIALRGSPSALVPLLRWIIAQVAARAGAGLGMVAALPASRLDDWGWFTTLPPARTSGLPLPGPRLATAQPGVYELLERVRQLLYARHQAAVANPHLRPTYTAARVIAFVDQELAGPAITQIATGGPTLGVHTVLVMGADRQPAAQCGFVLDVDPSGQALRMHRKGGQPIDCATDGVRRSYAADLATVLGALTR